MRSCGGHSRVLLPPTESRDEHVSCVRKTRRIDVVASRALRCVLVRTSAAVMAAAVAAVVPVGGCSTAAGPSPGPREHPPAAAPAPVEEGASFDAAVIVEAGDEKSGVARENEWIFRHYGRFRKKTVALASFQERRFDVITVELSDHTEKILYFDITAFFGK
jgi:hypothetical protein